MKTVIISAMAIMILSGMATAQKRMVSVGTRATISMFNEDKKTGMGLGGQIRYQFTDRLNSDWFADFITSHNAYTFRNDYHIGWSLMFYSKNNFDFTKTFQPYMVAGHCFDLSKISEKNNIDNNASRFSMAVQAGLGTHINITPRFDCSLTGQYMLHLGKNIETKIEKEKVVIEKQGYSSIDGHLLFGLSINYKIRPTGK